jgi:hypothetical protein
MRNAALVVVVLALTACGAAAPAARQAPGTTPVAVTGPSPSPSPASSPAPFVPPSPVAPGPTTPKPVAFSCSSAIPAGAQLALVTLRGSTDIVVRDITNLAQPVSRCAFKTCSQFCASYGPDYIRFVTSRWVSYMVETVDGEWAMYLADLQTRKTELIATPSAGGFFWVFAWSPDGSSLTYLTSDQWRIRSAAGDLALSPLGKDLGYNFDFDGDSRMVGFSADGHYVAVDQSIDLGTKQTAGGYAIQKGSLFKVVRLSDMKVVYSRSDGTMAIWAGVGAHLYFRTSSGLNEWNPIYGAQLVAPGLAWTDPVASADGQRIAYVTEDANGNHFARHLVLTDQPLRSISLSSLPRVNVAFLTPTLAWYAEESLCNGHCPSYGETSAGPPQTGRTYVHDLVTGTISTSVVTAVADSWPHLGSQ